MADNENYTDDDLKELEQKFDAHTINQNNQRLKQQNWLFWFVLSLSILLIAIAFFFAYRELAGTPANAEVVILGLIITAPVILLLALMRYIYDDDKKASTPQPTLLLNVGKELAAVLPKMFKK